MKTILTIFLLTVSVISAQAVVRIVDNNGNRPGGSNVYATFVLAHNAASTGDTLLIIPSTNSYGSVTISKSITVLGVGFNPDKSTLITSNFSIITISNSTTDLNLSGLVVGEISIGTSNQTNSMENIIIEKCQISSIYTGGSSFVTLSNIIIRQNYFNTPSTTFPLTLSTSTQSGIIIANNIFSCSSCTTNTSYGIRTSTGGLTIEQNLFFGSGNDSQYAFDQLTNSFVSNNIFFGRRPSSRITSTGVTFNNNISFGNNTNAFPTGAGFTLNNNQEVDPQFESAALGNYDFSKDVRLKAGSPALTAGPSSSEIGIYGGSTPYKNSGVSIPVVKTLTLPTAIKEGTNTSATISVNGN